MANVTISRNEQGSLSFYLPKKDLEDVITSIEFDTPTRWGGEIVLGDGGRYYLEPLDSTPRLPITLRAKRL